MIRRIDAIYENGIFRPEQPLSLPEGQRVSVTIDSGENLTDDLSDVQDLLETLPPTVANGQFAAPSVEEIRRRLAVVPGSVSDLICVERDER